MALIVKEHFLRRWESEACEPLHFIQEKGVDDYVDICYTLHFNNQPDALIIQIYSVIKLYMFRASSLPIIRSFLLYIRHW